MQSVSLVSPETKQVDASRALILEMELLILLLSLPGCVGTVNATPATATRSVSWREMEASAVWSDVQINASVVV